MVVEVRMAKQEGVARVEGLLPGIDGKIRESHRTRLHGGEQVFIADGWQYPNGLCESVWGTMSPFVMGLAHGVEDFDGGWMKNFYSAMISCNDSFRPVSFLLETMDEE